MAANQPTQMLTVPAGSQTHVSSPAGNFLHLTDFCKGMAIVWVFVIHYHGGWFGWQAVHVFIVLSGFGLAYSCLQKNTDPYGDSRGVRPRSARGLLSASHPAPRSGNWGAWPHMRVTNACCGKRR